MATIADLERVKGKAELVNSRIVLIEPHGGLPGYANSQIVFALGRYEDEYGVGQAFNGMPAYVVLLPRRESFCPDAAWYTGQLPANPMKFLPEAPRLLWKSEARTITEPKPNATLPIKSPTTLRQERLSYGMWTC